MRIPLCNGPTTKRLFGSLYSDSPRIGYWPITLIARNRHSLPQRRLAIPPPFHLLFSIFYPHHKVSIFCPILPRFLAHVISFPFHSLCHRFLFIVPFIFFILSRTKNRFVEEFSLFPKIDFPFLSKCILAARTLLRFPHYRNAWQKLGNMSPEAAMEQYVALVSDKVPGWTKDTSDGERKLESADQGVAGSVAPDIYSFPDKHAIFIHERNADSNTAPAGGDITESVSLEKQVHCEVRGSLEP
uniref:ACB domain-containing protein n=1 Tax=Gossypium raimondii TaxID=29730 RepID=A0A0D2SAE9_GOSRA|nr:hypothetical protein B456_013G078800 [Gossypium raimondii]